MKVPNIHILYAITLTTTNPIIAAAAANATSNPFHSVTKQYNRKCSNHKGLHTCMAIEQVYWPRMPYDTQQPHSFGNERKSNSQPTEGYWAASPAPYAHGFFICSCLFLFGLRAANNCRWLYTMSDSSGIIPYSGCRLLSSLHFGISPIVSAYALFTTIAYTFISNSRFVRRWKMHNCIIINWWPLISGRFIDISVSVAARTRQAFSHFENFLKL